MYLHPTTTIDTRNVPNFVYLFVTIDSGKLYNFSMQIKKKGEGETQKSRIYFKMPVITEYTGLRTFDNLRITLELALKGATNNLKCIKYW